MSSECTSSGLCFAFLLVSEIKGALQLPSCSVDSWSYLSSVRKEVLAVSDTKQSRTAESNSDWTGLDHLPSVSSVFSGEFCLILCLKHPDVSLRCARRGRRMGSFLYFGWSSPLMAVCIAQTAVQSDEL